MHQHHQKMVNIRKIKVAPTLLLDDRRFPLWYVFVCVCFKAVWTWMCCVGAPCCCSLKADPQLFSLLSRSRKSGRADREPAHFLWRSIPVCVNTHTHTHTNHIHPPPPNTHTHTHTPLSNSSPLLCRTQTFFYFRPEYTVVHTNNVQRVVLLSFLHTFFLFL